VLKAFVIESIFVHAFRLSKFPLVFGTIYVAFLLSACQTNVPEKSTCVETESLMRGGSRGRSMEKIAPAEIKAVSKGNRRSTDFLKQVN
jgi:hypothetical protein